jgi:hypothetical protein
VKARQIMPNITGWKLKSTVDETCFPMANVKKERKKYDPSKIEVQ